MTGPRVSAIVVTFNSAREIGSCLRSLQASSYPPAEIIVVDNDSRDGTPDLVRREFPDVTLLDYLDNPGFGEANNRAFRVASGELVFLLNPDAAVAPDALETLVHALAGAGRGGIAVPKVVLAGDPAVLNSAGLLMNRVGYGWDRGYLERDTGQYDGPAEPIGGSGCALLLSAALVAELSGFDPSYFLYYEDLDLCLRARLAGWEIRWVPRAVVSHAMKVSGRPVTYNEYLDHRNRWRTMLKDLPKGELARRLPALLLFDVRALAHHLRSGSRQAFVLRARALLWNLVHLPSTLRERRRVSARAVPGASFLPLLSPDGGTPRLLAALPQYREVYEREVDAARIDTSVRMGDGDEGSLGLGWHGVEADGAERYRWSCGYGTLFVRNPAPGREATLTLRCHAAIAVTARVLVGHREAGDLRVSPGWHDHALAFTRGGDVLRIDFLVDPVYVPSESGSPDPRVLGVAVARVAVRAGGA